MDTVLARGGWQGLHRGLMHIIAPGVDPTGQLSHIEITSGA